MATIALMQALPELIRDLEGDLIRIGRGAVADQLAEVSLSSWEYDENANAAYLYVRHPENPEIARRELIYATDGETISLYDELGVNVDVDNRGRIVGIEILGANRIVPELKKVAI